MNSGGEGEEGGGRVSLSFKNAIFLRLIWHLEPIERYRERERKMDAGQIEAI